MQFLPVLSLSLLFFVGNAGVASEVTNPIAKVLSLIESLIAKINKHGAAEEKAFTDYMAWCGDAAQNKGFEIKAATADKARLEANIGKQAGLGEAADAAIQALGDAIAQAEGELSAATAVRNKEAADFAASEKDLMETLDAIRRALAILTREQSKNPAAFAQMDTSNLNQVMKALNMMVDASTLSIDDRQKLLSFSQSQQASANDDEEFAAPAAAVYKSHSGNIIDVLEDLKDKAEEQLASLRKAEVNAKHNFQMLKQSLEDQLAAQNKDLDDNKKGKAEAEGAKAGAEGDLAQTIKDLTDGKRMLETINSDCKTMTADHDESVKSRAEELAALNEALKILSESTGGAVDQTYSLFQLAQQSKLQTRTDLANAEVLTLVKRLAREQHSAALAQLASQIAAVVRYGASAGEDPFAKVKGLITDMIARLEKEAGLDATEKAYCDEQMAKTEAKKADLDGNIAKLTTKIDSAAAASARLKQDVKELQAELNQLAREQAEMDSIRQEQHAAYVTAKADLEQGLAGVRQALVVLRDYYGSAASFAQQPETPNFHEAATGTGHSIIGILEVAESDFAKNLAEEESHESDATASYEKETQANKITQTLKDQDVTYKTKEFKGLDKDIAELSGDRNTESSELSAVLAYYANIKGRCIAKPETYAERRRRREAEIAGLKEALNVLENETALMQSHKRGNKFLRNRPM